MAGTIDMLYGDYVTLISVKTEQDEDGFQKNIETENEVYADIRSTTRSEFYDAMRSGIAVSIMIKISAHDYNNERLLIYDDERYEVVRAYKTDLDHIELSCSEVTR